MPTLVLTTPTNPGFATWTDSTLIPGAGITVEKGATVVAGTTTLNFIGAGVSVAAGAPGTADVTIGGGGGAVPGGVENSVQINDGSGGFGGDANLTYDGTYLTVATGGPVIDIGQGFITGGPNLTVETQAGGTLTLDASTLQIASGGVAAYTLPVIDGAAGDVLTTNGAGVATWQPAAGGGGVPSAPVNSLQFNNAGAFGGDARLTYNSVSNVVGLTDGVNPTITLDGTAASIALSTIDPFALRITDSAAAADLIIVDAANYTLSVYDPITPGGAITLSGSSWAVNTSDGAGLSSNMFPAQVDITAAGNTLKLTIPAGAATLTSEDGAAIPQALTVSASTTTFASGTAYVLASMGAAPPPASVRVNAVHVVAPATVGPILLPIMLAADDGLRIEVANNTAGPMQITPPAGGVLGAGIGRAMSDGGGSAWVWVNALATWICTANV